MRLMSRLLLLPAALLASLITMPAPAADAVLVSALEVTITSGGVPLAPATQLALKLYEAGPLPRVVPLSVGGAWPAGATRLIRIALERPLDPRRVRRFALAYVPGHADATAWEVEDAHVEWVANGERQRLLAATLSGLLAGDRELASEEVRDAALRCATDADCDDGHSCNGTERCDARDPRADARGCVAGRPVLCPVNQVCVEHAGCRGVAPPSH